MIQSLVNQYGFMTQPRRTVYIINCLQNGKVPYIITKKMNDLLYLVKKSPKQAPKALYIDQLSPYRGQNLPKWSKSNNK